jgi:protein dithiol oxidoreductase (disulfide-forming)
LYLASPAAHLLLEFAMRIYAALMGFALSLLSYTALAADTYQEGKDYAVLSEPVAPKDPTKIEVTEVFSYLCPHCFHFEPLLAAWAKKQPADVALVQVHASFNHNWPIYQRGFYTMQALGLKDKAHQQVFDTIHVAHKELLTAQAWGDFLSLYGADKAAVVKTFDSFGVTTQMKQADGRVRDLKITSTPQLIINGKYRVTASKHEEILKVAQFLVDKIRAERAKK